MIHPMLQPKAAWAEDRALPRSNPSSHPGAKTGAGARHSPAPLPFYSLRIGNKAINLRGRMPRLFRQDALPNSLTPNGKNSTSR